MYQRLSTTTTLILIGVSIISCSEATAPERPIDEVAGPSLAVAANSWGTRANMPSDRYSPILATVNNAQGQTVLYAIAGTTSPYGRVPLGKVQVYNAATNSWTTRASLPVPVYNSNGAGVINGKIYLSGGSTSDGRSANLFMYNPATNQWTRKKPMPFPSTNGVTGVYQNKLYVLIGSAMYRYDPATDVWTFLSSGPRDHYAGQGGFIGGKFYLAGGVSLGRTLSVFDPATNTWTTRASMPAGRIFAASATIGAKLYLAGGIEEDVNNNGWTFHSKSVIRYDPATDRWTTLTPMPSLRDGISGGRVSVNGQQRFEVIGGARPGNNLQYTP